MDNRLSGITGFPVITYLKLGACPV